MAVDDVNCSMLKTIKSVFLFPQVFYTSDTVCQSVSKQILNFGPSVYYLHGGR